MKLSRKNQKTLTWVAIALVALLVVAIIPTLFNPADDSGYNKVNVTYEVGSIDETGVFAEDECALYSKKLIECTGFKLTADFDSNIEYEVHYYDEDDKWISSVKSSDLQLEVAVGDMPEGATGIRIVIRPLEDDNEKIGLFERSKYANQLTVQITTEEVESDAAAE